MPGVPKVCRGSSGGCVLLAALLLLLIIPAGRAQIFEYTAAVSDWDGDFGRYSSAEAKPFAFDYSIHPHFISIPYACAERRPKVRKHTSEC